MSVTTCATLHERFGYDRALCCRSCHDDEEDGYSDLLGLPDDIDAEVCCKATIWYEENILSPPPGAERQK